MDSILFKVDAKGMAMENGMICSVETTGYHNLFCTSFSAHYSRV